jgi:hypothetical protein
MLSARGTCQQVSLSLPCRHILRQALRIVDTLSASGHPYADSPSPAEGGDDGGSTREDPMEFLLLDL